MAEFYRDLNVTEKYEGIPKPLGPQGKISHGKKMTVKDDDFLENWLDIVANDPSGKALTSWSSTGKIKSWTWAKLHARAMAAAYEISEKMDIEPGSNVGQGFS